MSMTQRVPPGEGGFPGSKRGRPIGLTINGTGRERLVPLGSYAERIAYLELLPLNLVGRTLATDDQVLDTVVRLAGAEPGPLERWVCRFAPRQGAGRELVRGMLGQAVEAATRAEPVGTPAGIERAERNGFEMRRAAQFRLLNLRVPVVVETTSVSIADISESTIEEAIDNAEFKRADDAPARRWRGAGWREQAAQTLLALGMNRCLVPECLTRLSGDALGERRRRRHYCRRHADQERGVNDLSARRHDARLEAVASLLDEAARLVP